MPRASGCSSSLLFFDLSFETLTEKLLGAYSKGVRRKVVDHGRPDVVMRRSIADIHWTTIE
jgi:hypothetical protein